MSNHRYVAIGLLGITLTLWVLSPFAGVLFYRGLIGLTVLWGTACLWLRPEMRPALAARPLVPFAVFAALHLVSAASFPEAVAAGYNPDIRALAVSAGLFVLALGWFRAPGAYRRLVRGVVTGTAVLTAVLILWHLVIFKSLFLTPTLLAADFVTGFTRKNQLAFFLALVFPFAWAALVYRPRWRTLVPVILIGFSQLYTFSRMAVLATALAIVLPCVVSRGAARRFRVAAVLAAVLAVGGVAAGLTPARFLDLRLQGQLSVIPAEQLPALEATGEQWIDWNLSRARYVMQALEGFPEAPVFGHGVASFNRTHLEQYPDGTLIRRSLTHNDYAQIVYELGGLGLAAFLAMLLMAIHQVWRAGPQLREDGALIDGQLTALVILAVILNLINAYETLVFWVLMAGSVSLNPQAQADA